MQSLEQNRQSFRVIPAQAGIQSFLFSSTSAHHKHLTLFLIITYEKPTPQFSTIQAIWRTIRRYFESYSRQFESNSRAIRDNWRYSASHPSCPVRDGQAISNSYEAWKKSQIENSK